MDPKEACPCRDFGRHIYEATPEGYRCQFCLATRKDLPPFPLPKETNATTQA